MSLFGGGGMDLIAIYKKQMATRLSCRRPLFTSHFPSFKNCNYSCAVAMTTKVD